jgi:two-component system cell cycle response regulator
MPARSAERYTVALQGFSGFERSTLSSFFRLATKRSPSYEEVDDIDRCDFIVADADDDASLAAVLGAGRAHDAVFVGARAPQGAMAWLPRPIDPMHIVRELDSLVGHRHSAPGELLAALAHVGPSADATAPADAADSFAPVGAGGRGGNVLVAEDSAIARRFLQVRLQRLGYVVHLATSGDEALQRLAEQPFAIVFLDVVLGPAGSLDGLSLCHRLKHEPQFAIDGRPPRVVLVTGLSGAMDKVRGTLAGCDAYLTKPLSDKELLHALSTLDEGFAAAGRRPQA